MKRILIALLLTLIPAAALAADKDAGRPHWSLEFKGGAFFPSVEHFSSFYGGNWVGEFGGALAYQLTNQIEVGIEGSYSRADGKAQAPGHVAQGNLAQAAADATYESAPVSVFVTARAFFDRKQWLVPYIGGGYTRLFYRQRVSGQGETRGSVNGYHGKAGLQFLLDPLDPEAANNIFRDYGVYRTYFFIEGRYLHATADTVPSGSVNAGGLSTLAGVRFEF